MGTMYVSQPGAEVRKHRGRLRVVDPGGRTLASLPVREVDRVVLLAPVQVSAAAARLLLKEGIPLAYGSTHGRYYGMLSLGWGDVERWLVQVAAWQDAGFRLETARAIVGAKIRNQRSVLRRQARNHPDDLVTQAADRLGSLLAPLEDQPGLDQVRGFEGQAAALYFGVLGRCLRQEGVAFNGRSRRPPRDPVNAVLSLGYMLLLGEVTSALAFEGLHPGLGFLHEPSRRYQALALDLLELFRQPVADRLALSLFNRGVLGPGDFQEEASGGVLLRPESLRRFLSLYERVLTTPFRTGGREATWRLVLGEQASGLRASLEGHEPWSPWCWEP